jgi:hypothetical protein
MIEHNPASSCVRSLPQSSQTTHSNDVSRVRIIRPHHPLFGQWVSVVRLWEHKKKRYYIIELPDKSHTRIPLYWADNGKFPLVKNAYPEQPFFTAKCIQNLISIILVLKDSHVNHQTSALSSPEQQTQEDTYGKPDSTFPHGGRS